MPTGDLFQARQQNVLKLPFFGSDARKSQRVRKIFRRSCNNRLCLGIEHLLQTFSGQLDFQRRRPLCLFKRRHEIPERLALKQYSRTPGSCHRLPPRAAQKLRRPLPAWVRNPAFQSILPSAGGTTLSPFERGHPWGIGEVQCSPQTAFREVELIFATESRPVHERIHAAVRELKELGIVDEKGNRVRTDLPEDMQEGADRDFG